jgi:hypothetical protein
MLLPRPFPARRGPFLGRILLTLIGVHWGHDNRRPLRPGLGYIVYKEYVEQESGGTGKRSEFQALYADAHQRRFDLVLFWIFDRFNRE